MNEFLQKLIKSFFSKNNVYYLYLRLDFIMENVKLFEKNLNAIKSYDIDLYNQLVSLPSNDGALSLAYTKQNEPNLLYQNYPLHSPNGAIDEATNIIKSLNVTSNLAMDYDFVMHTPLMWLDKAQTWELADKYGKLEYVREKTLTCYNGIIGDGCGECPSCKLRQNGLETYLKQKEELCK